jgi:hypothetical protein
MRIGSAAGFLPTMPWCPSRSSSGTPFRRPRRVPGLDKSESGWVGAQFEAALVANTQSSTTNPKVDARTSRPCAKDVVGASKNVAH